MRLIALLCLVLAAPARAGVDQQSPLGDAGKGLSETALTPQTLACLILSDEDCAAGANAAKMIAADARKTPLAPPLFSAREDFDRVLAAYPNGSVEQFKAIIGRSQDNWITNTCAMRVSYAMNFSGVEQFRIDRSLLGAEKNINYITDKSLPRKGGVYIYRVDELANYMMKRYGKPQIWAKGGDLSRAVKGKTGIILFVVNGWTDATGHFDLWDGEKAAHEQYFDKSSDVFLWQ